MRICHIISGDLWAGAEVMNYNLIKGLKIFKNLEQSTILLNEGKLAEEIRKLGIEVAVVDENRFNIFKVILNVKNILKQRSPDIIHSHGRKQNILSYLAAKRNKNIKLICTQHGMQEPINIKLNIIKNKLLETYHIFILLKYFNYVVVVSEDMRNSFIRQYGFRRNKVILIHNGTNMPENYTLKKDREFFKIGSAGRFFPVKDYPLMVEIANEVIKQTDKIRFELAGDGPEREKILDMIRKYKLVKVFNVVGFVDNMTNYYQDLDLYINTSLHEGLPMSILEAMAHGLPIIAPNTGGLKEILNNETQGYLVDSRNPKLFAEKCLELCSDPKLLKNMGNSSRLKIMNEFSIEKMADKYYNVYIKVLEQQQYK